VIQRRATTIDGRDWLKAIEFRERDAPGYWEVRGYHHRGDPWTEQRYSDD
jgi:DMSO/TMAO reductase YedYZ molybdopterin-dependent catalytic subunit